MQKLVDLPSKCNITTSQWSVLNSQLSAMQSRLLSRLKKDAKECFPLIHDSKIARRFNSLISEIELEMARAFSFFDTYMDVLTQRLTPKLGIMLAGCDVLAWDAINKNHPALAIVEPPLVYCDRGFGASILREGVVLPDRTPNPMPLIQIPYSRLKEKHNLTSILHEVGHQAMVYLGLVSSIPKAIHLALKKTGAPDSIIELFTLWSSEMGPDFWTFCASGIAQAGGIKEILSLPTSHVFRISWTDTHPMPFLRVLLSFEWCRQIWGRGIWDDWEKEWLEFYPLDNVSPRIIKIVNEAWAFLPVVSKVFLNTKFRVLNGKTIASLFSLSSLDPARHKKIAEASANGSLKLRGLSPSEHLSVFRLIREQGKLKEEEFDGVMTKWLLGLGEKNMYFH